MVVVGMRIVVFCGRSSSSRSRVIITVIQGICP